MLGILRFFLASCVIIFHLSAQIPHIGLLAVNFFYVISGYLITLILNDTYKFKFKEFSINRFLRLYPIYYAISLFAIALTFIPIAGATSIGFHKNTTGTYQPLDLIANILIFPFALINDSSVISIPWHNAFTGIRFRWLSTSWSVAVELICYFSLFVFTARNAIFALVTMLLSIVFQWAVVHYNHNILLNYSTVMAGLMPFALGSLGYFISKSFEHKLPFSTLDNKKQIIVLLTIITMFMVNWFFASKEYGEALFTSVYFYLNTFIALIAVLLLHGMKPTGIISRTGKLLGDMSYPIFLCHFMCAYIAWQILGQPNYKTGWDIFWVTYPITLGVAYITVKLVDEPIQKIRNKVRPS